METGAENNTAWMPDRGNVRGRREGGMKVHRTMNMRGFIVILILALSVFLIFHLMLRGTLNEKERQETELQEELAKLEERNRELNNQLARVGTDDYIVSSAIRDYSFMNKDDIRFEYDHPEALQAYSEAEFTILMEEMKTYSGDEFATLLEERLK